MRVGICGMGKLGLPVALAIESKGHKVSGYDVSPRAYEYMSKREIPFVEEGIEPLLKNHQIQMLPDVSRLVESSELIFLPVQTPHSPKFEGSTRIPATRADFDYSYLVQAIKDIAEQAELQKKDIDLAVISTCLPGTYNRLIREIIEKNPRVKYVYTPQFIAMGTVLQDYLFPEFNLIGVESEGAARRLQNFYRSINDAPCVITDITTAEGIKVSYNTWITAKTVLANTWGEMSYRLGMNFDDILKAWSLSTRRLISTRYMDSGVGDGGGCHPRDNIALSYIAKEIKMSHNIWEDLMGAREDHMTFIADLAIIEADSSGLPIFVMGEAFKPETNIKTGSPAVLLANIISETGDVTVIPDLQGPTDRGVYVLGIKHDVYKDFEWPKGSVIIDPFRYLDEQDGIKLIQIGKNNGNNTLSSV